MDHLSGNLGGLVIFIKKKRQILIQKLITTFCINNNLPSLYERNINISTIRQQVITITITITTVDFMRRLQIERRRITMSIR